MPMYLIGQQLEGVFEDQGVLGHLERLSFQCFHLPVAQYLPYEHRNKRF